MPVITRTDLIARYGGDEHHFIHVLDHLFLPAAQTAGFGAIRPIAEGAELIHAKIIAELRSADLVLCDMSGGNPNVFFELGIRTALDRPVSLVKDQYSHAPFDTASLNYYTYDAAMGPWRLKTDIDLLARHIDACHRLASGRNALWVWFGNATSTSGAENTPGPANAIVKASIDDPPPTPTVDRPPLALPESSAPTRTSPAKHSSSGSTHIHVHLHDDDSAVDTASTPDVRRVVSSMLEPLLRRHVRTFKYGIGKDGAIDVYIDGKAPSLNVRKQLYAAVTANNYRLRIHSQGDIYTSGRRSD